MGRKSKIAAVAAVFVVALVAVGAYFYDRSQDGKIAAGVTIDGIDVGGMGAASAERELRGDLLRPVDRPLGAEFGERSWKLSPTALKVRADINGAVAEAVAASREGSLPTRLGRYLGGDDLELAISADLAYSHSAIN